MSPVASVSSAVHPRFPRVSGDEPEIARAEDVNAKFSPRERG